MPLFLMTDTIYLRELVGDTLFGRAVFSAIHEHGRDKFDELGIQPNSPDPITVEFKVNGADLSLKEYFQRLEQHTDRLVEEKARELVAKYLRDQNLQNRVCEMVGVIERFEKDLVARFPQYSEQDDS